MRHKITSLKRVRIQNVNLTPGLNLIDMCPPSPTPILRFLYFLLLFIFHPFFRYKTRSFLSLNFIASHVKRSCYTYSTGAPLTRRIMLDLAFWSHFRRHSGFEAAHTPQCQCSELLRGGLAAEVMQDWIAGDEICAVVYHSWCACWGVQLKWNTFENWPSAPF